MTIPKLPPPLGNLERDILKARGRESTCPLKTTAKRVGLFLVCGEPTLDVHVLMSYTGQGKGEEFMMAW